MTAYILSVAIPCHNEEYFLVRLLRMLEKQSLPSNLYEVIVIDNGSTDRTNEAAWSYAAETSLNLRLVHEPILGVSRARNAGARASSGATIIFLDADNTVPEDFLAKLVDYINVKNVSAGTIRTLAEGVSIRGRVVFLILEAIKVISGRPFGKSFATRSLFEMVGGFNEQIVLGENVDFLRRLKKCAANHNARFGHFRVSIRCSLRRFKKQGYFKTLLPWLIAYFGFYTLRYSTMASIEEGLRKKMEQ